MIRKHALFLWATIFVIASAIAAVTPRLGRASELATYSFPSIYGGRIDTRNGRENPTSW